MKFFLILVFSLLVFNPCLYFVWILRFKTKITSSENRDKKSHQVLLYHKIDDRWEWGITRQKIKQFEKQMRFLYQRGFRLTSLEDGFFSFSLKEKKKIFLTFDDGYRSVYTQVLPILEKYGFSATVFLITGWIGKKNLWDFNWGREFQHLSWSQIEELKGFGFGFGSHTVNHPDLTKLNEKELEYELMDSKNALENRLGKRIDFLSYPFGKCNEKVKRIAKKAGYRCAFSICSDPDNPSDPFALGRLGMYLFDSRLTLNIKLKRTPLFWIEDMKGRIINRFANGTILFKGKPQYDYASEAEKPKSILVKKV